MKTTILVAEEHEIVRSGIVSALNSHKDFEIAAETSDGRDVLFLVREHRPNIVIMDMSLPGMSGLEIAQELIHNNSDVKIMYLTMQLNEMLLVQAIRSGASGYIMKNADRNDLIEGVRQVSRGKHYFSEQVLNMMADFYIKQHRPNSSAPSTPVNLGLTPREIEILQMIADSMTSQDIADKLFISLRTVETHRSNIMSKLGIKNSAGLVRFAIENGLAGARPMKIQA
jgi:DNA-binding NarL/FixJ family response regulator